MFALRQTSDRKDPVRFMEFAMMRRRSVLMGAAAAALCRPALATARKPYAFDAKLFPRYDLAVDIDRGSETLNAHARIVVPRSLVRDGTIVFALTEDAKDVVVRIDRGAPVTPVPRMDAAGVAPLRRWIVPAPPGSATLILSIRYRLTAAVSPVFAIKSDGAVASGTGTAWYPQIEREGNVRLEGTGRLRIVSGSDVVVAGGRNVAPGVFEIEEPRYFEFAAAPYRLVTSRKGRARLYLLRDHPDTDGFAEHLDRLTAVLESHFGPLPQRRFDLAEAPPLCAQAGGFDGSSLDGFMLAVGFYFDQPFNTAFFGHEVSHQWWGGLVRRTGLDGVYMLDECLAQYGSMLAVEDIEGPRAAALYRRRGFPGYYAEYGGFSYLARSLAGIDAPLTALPVSDGFVCRRVANAKGMLVWSMLADLVGRERLSAFLRGFVASHAYRRARFSELMDGVRKLAGKDAWFMDWFEKTGAAEMTLQWSQTAAGLAVTIAHAGSIRPLCVPVEIRFRDGRTRTVWTGGTKTTLALKPGEAVTDVVLDPHNRILRWTPQIRAEAETILPYTEGDIALNYGKNDEARKAFEAALPAASGEFAALLERGLGDVDFGEQKYQSAVAHYRKALALAPDHAQVPEIWRALADAWRALKDDAQARDANLEGARAIARMLQSG